MPVGSEVLTVEVEINLLTPARGERLVARGRVLRSGRTIPVCQGDVHALRHGDATHCATMTAIMLRVPSAPTAGRTTTSQAPAGALGTGTGATRCAATA